MRIILAVFLLLAAVGAALAEGPIAQDLQNKGQLIQTIKVQRNTAGTTPNRCDTVAASGTVTYAVGNTSVISISATDATYNEVTVLRYWDSDTAYMPIIGHDTLVPGRGLQTMTVSNVTSANAIICVERQVNGDGGP